MLNANNENDRSLIKKFTNYIINNKNFSFTKFGDGEVRCMRNWLYGQNCDGDKYNRWLSNSLKNAFKNLIKMDNVYLGKWHDLDLVSYLTDMAKKEGVSDIKWAHYHTVMNASPVKNTTNFNSFLDDALLNFVKAIKESKRKKIIFSNIDNIKLKDFFSADVFIETKKNNWSYDYQEYFRKLDAELADDAILIIAAGLCSKVLISDILNKYNMTCIDVGSGYDIIASGNNSRGWGHSYQDELNYYKDIL